MGSFWLNGGQVAGTLDFYRSVCIIDEERGFQASNRFNWTYHSRSEQMSYTRGHYFEGWSRGQFIDQGSGIALLLGQDTLEDGQSFDEWQVSGNHGYKRPQYLYGQIQDANNSPVNGATVRSFITSTNVYDGSTLSDAQGYYQCPCYTPTVTHYLVVYLAGSPDTSSTSVNTLVPTN